MNRPIVALLCFSFIFSSSCTDKRHDPNLVGTWDVTKVQGQRFDNGNPGIILTDNNPTGYIRFNRNGTGRQDYSFSIFGLTYDNTGDFIWRTNEDEVIIERFSQPDLIWQRITDEPDIQVATYTNVVNSTTSWDYTLTLEK